MKFQRGLRNFVAELTPIKIGFLIFFLSFFVRLAAIIVFHPYHDLGRFELERTAISLATTGVYGNPYALPTGRSAHVSPGYTLILAGLYRLFGTGTSAEIVKEVLASLVTSVQYALLPALAGAVGIDRRAGVLAGLISAIYPVKLATQINGSWETPYTALFLMLISAQTVWLWKRPSREQQSLTTRTALLCGFSWGVALLFVSALLPMFFAFVLIGAYYWRHRGFVRYVSFAALEVLVVAACLAPWAIRNYYALGSPILTRSNFGIEMRISNNDLATPNERMNDERGLYAMYHPLQNVTEALKVRQMGEVAYNKQALDQAKDWIQKHPLNFVRLCLGRLGWFWFFTDPTSKMKTAFLDITVILGFLGLIYIYRSDRVTGTVFALILLFYPLPNYLIHLGLRQKYPIDWMMTLLSVAMLVHWAQAHGKDGVQRIR